MDRVITFLLICAFSTLLITEGVPTYASITVTAVLGERILVVFNFENINSTVWDKIKQYIDDITFPMIIRNKLYEKNLTRVFYSDPKLELNSSARSMRASFSLSGLDIVSFTYNKTTAGKICQVKTDWRKFYTDFKDGQGVPFLILDFAKYFDEPVSKWKREENYTLNGRRHLAYHHNYIGPTSFDPSCYFILPEGATNVKVEDDTITFELPPTLEDALINSPFPILGALIATIAIASLYRRIATLKSKTKERKGKLASPTPG